MSYILSNPSPLTLPSACLPSKDLLNSSQSLELPPILDENLPNSMHTVSNITSLSDNISSIPPAFLEPTPIVENHHFKSKFSPKFPNPSKDSIQNSPPTLIPSSSSSCSSVSSTSPSPIMRSASPPYPLQSDNTVSIINSDLYTPIPRCPTGTKLHPLVPIQSKHIYQNDIRYPSLWNKQDDHVEEVRSPPSPTMMAASATAAAESIQNRPSSDVFSNNFDQKVLQLRVSDESNHNVSRDNLYEMDAYSSMHFMSQASKPFSVTANQSMFLTKNAHIKRPRNAWIRFRCHYGQALKSQNPTLRAEEISKRASRRWANLSEMEKKPWHDLAEQEKQAHKEAFPNYRYCPRRSNTTAFAGEHPSVKQISLYNKFGLGDEENKNKKRRL